MKRGICLTEPRALLPRGGTGRGQGHRRRCPLLTLLPCCLPIEVWAIQTDARAPGGGKTDRRGEPMTLKSKNPAQPSDGRRDVPLTQMPKGGDESGGRATATAGDDRALDDDDDDDVVMVLT